MILFALRMLGFARQAVSSAFAVVVRYPMAAGLVGAVVLAGWQYHGKRGALRERDDALVALAKQAKDYRTAQEVAQTMQDETDRANLATQTERNKRLTDDNAKAESARADAVRDYIAGHRVRCGADEGPPRLAGSAGVHPDPAKPADPTEVSELVAVTTNDLDALTAEAMHGAERYNYLQSLIAEGIAIPDPAF
jgi:hypothetical protein